MGLYIRDEEGDSYNLYRTYRNNVCKHLIVLIKLTDHFAHSFLSDKAA